MSEIFSFAKKSTGNYSVLGFHIFQKNVALHQCCLKIFTHFHHLPFQTLAPCSADVLSANVANLLPPQLFCKRNACLSSGESASITLGTVCVELCICSCSCGELSTTPLMWIGAGFFSWRGPYSLGSPANQHLFGAKVPTFFKKMFQNGQKCLY